YATYERLVERGVARELARLVMPVAAYTEFYWTINARSLMNFVSLRAAETAQREIRRYAEACERFLEEKMPVTYAAFVAAGRIAPVARSCVRARPNGRGRRRLPRPRVPDAPPAQGARLPRGSGGPPHGAAGPLGDHARLRGRAVPPYRRRGRDSVEVADGGGPPSHSATLGRPLLPMARRPRSRPPARDRSREVGDHAPRRRAAGPARGRAPPRRGAAGVAVARARASVR